MVGGKVVFTSILETILDRCVNRDNADSATYLPALSGCMKWQYSLMQYRVDFISFNPISGDSDSGVTPRPSTCVPVSRAQHSNGIATRATAPLPAPAPYTTNQANSHIDGTNPTQRNSSDSPALLGNTADCATTHQALVKRPLENSNTKCRANGFYILLSQQMKFQSSNPR